MRVEGLLVMAVNLVLLGDAIYKFRKTKWKPYKLVIAFDFYCFCSGVLILLGIIPIS